MCRRYGATLYTMSVVSSETTYDVQPPDPFYLRYTAERKMAKFVTSGVFEGIKHHELIKKGFDSVSKVLLGLIDSLLIDLIVLGLHGRSGIKKLVLGSVATDLQPGSARVLLYTLAADDNAHLTLLHVIKTPTDSPSERREAQKDIAMKQLVQLLPPETSTLLETQSIVEISMPQERIPKVAEDLRADLIVIGPHHTFHPRISAHLPWAMLRQVLGRGRCPVLRV